MNCPKIREHLSAYLDGELEDHLVRMVEEHLASCEACRRELEGLVEVCRLLSALPRRPAPREIEQDVMSYVERDMLLPRREEPRRAFPTRRVLNVLTLAAAVFVVALGAYFAFFPEPASPPAPEPDSTAVGRESVALKSTVSAPSRDENGKGLVAENYVPADDRKRGTGVGEEKTSASDAVVPGVTTGTPTPGGPATVATRPEPAPAVENPAATLETRRVTMREALTVPPEGTKEDVTAQPARPTGTELYAKDLGRAAKPAWEKSAGPEVLTLVLAARDFDAARKDISDVARSLDILSGDASYAYPAYRWGGSGAAPATPGKEAGLRETARDLEALKLKSTAAERGDVVDGDAAVKGEAGGQTPAMVLVLEEEKLPQLVAKLASRQLTADDGRTASYEFDRVQAAPSRAAGSTAGQLVFETKSELKDARELENAELRRRADEVAKELQRADELRKKRAETQTPPATTTAPATTPVETAEGDKPAERSAETGARLTPVTPAEEAAQVQFLSALKRKAQKDAHLVYIYVYLKPWTPPAAKEAGKEPAKEPVPVEKK